jgi:DNA-binding response OmpR family regulator
MTERTTVPPSNRKRVLVVEDDDGLREAISRTLSRAGYEVILAATGAAALLAGRETRPDAAIIDVLLPDAGGLGIAEGLRGLAVSMPVLFITGLAIYAVQKALALAPVLFKPFTKKQLLTSVRRMASAG